MICYFEDLYALLPTLGEYQKVLNLIAVNSFRRVIRSQRSSLVYLLTKIRTDTFENLNMNHVFVFPSVRTSTMVGLHCQSFQHSTS